MGIDLIWNDTNIEFYTNVITISNMIGILIRSFYSCDGPSDKNADSYFFKYQL